MGGTDQGQFQHVAWSVCLAFDDARDNDMITALTHQLVKEARPRVHNYLINTFQIGKMMLMCSLGA